MSLPAPVAFVSKDREILVLDRRETLHRHTLELDTPLMWGTWQLGAPRVAAFSWPTWSPDGRNLACFRLPSEEIPSARVFVHEVGGVSSVQLLDLGERLPIYLHWAPAGDRIAVLSQQRDRLRLSTGSLDHAGRETTLAEGSPLFFTWADAGRVAAYVGDLDGAPSRVSLVGPDGAGRDLPGRPGNFCAPLWLGGRVVYVTQDDGHTHVVSATDLSSRPERIEEVSGLVALIASPDGHTLARAVAPDGDGTPYRDVALIDVATGGIRAVIDIPCLAFLWAPTGDRLLLARVDTERNLLEWLSVSLDGDFTHVCDMYPTRDLGFYLRFFEQYSQSHTLIDPTGRYAVLAGTMVDHGQSDNTPRIWKVSLDDGSREELDEGLFAVWGPTSAPL